MFQEPDQPILADRIERSLDRLPTTSRLRSKYRSSVLAMPWKGKLSLFFVNSGWAADAIFYSPHRTPIRFSFQPIGLISAPENVQPI
jgi:hypothetical protein